MSKVIPALQQKNIIAWISELQGDTLPGVWSKGVVLAKNHQVVLDRVSESGGGGELRFRVRVSDRSISPVVTVWPGGEDGDQDAHCDCGDKNDPCHHVVACLLAVKNGSLSDGSEEAEGSSSSITIPKIIYRFSQTSPQSQSQAALHFERTIRFSARTSVQQGAQSAQSDFLFNESLVSIIGGIRSGRLKLPTLAATQEDLSVDAYLSQCSLSRGVLKSHEWAGLFEKLKGLPNLEFMGDAGAQPVTLGAPIGAGTSGGAWILKGSRDEGFYFSLRSGDPDADNSLGKNTGTHEAVAVTFDFSNGVTLEKQGELFTLRARSVMNLGDRETALLGSFNGQSGQAQRFRSPPEIYRLLSEALPLLQRKYKVVIEANRLPTLISEVKPQVEFEIWERSSVGNPELIVTPRLRYAEFEEKNGVWIDLKKNTVLERDEDLESELSFSLRKEWSLQFNHPYIAAGKSARELSLKIQKNVGSYLLSDKSKNTLERYTKAIELVPRLKWDDVNEQAKLEWFDRESGAMIGVGFPSDSTFSGEGGDLVSLMAFQTTPSTFTSALYGKIPDDWRAQYGDRIEAILRSQSASSSANGGKPARLKKHLLPSLVDLFERVGSPLPQAFEKYQKAKNDPYLPSDLNAELRDYQKEGVKWLKSLETLELGALLADDMGLGKTLQALCVLPVNGDHPSLVICPTSVLSSWTDQIKRFRPGLKLSLYYGSQRKIDRHASVILTTYGILRQDAGLLTTETWNTVILDEAQMIRNAESQVAQAAHLLRARFRIALTGTPIENRLSDLWSLFRYLLPSAADLHQKATESESTHATLARARPFILRRLKKDVASELPQKTEMVLECELSQSERKVYESLWISARKEVLGTLDLNRQETQGASRSGAQFFSILEVLLRLRQASTHTGLLKHLVSEDEFPSSSKLDLLVESLENSLENGHSALIFSQWTSLLDLLEKVLNARGKEKSRDYLRIDGSTQNRGEIIDRFQTPDGPPVLLLSLKAGGVGLNLTRADHVYIIDPWWNPAVESQAIDRAHRIGQERPVWVYRLVAKDTLDEKIIALQASKRLIAEQALGDDRSGDADLSTQLTLTDLEALFS